VSDFNSGFAQADGSGFDEEDPLDPTQGLPTGGESSGVSGVTADPDLSFIPGDLSTPDDDAVHLESGDGTVAGYRPFQGLANGNLAYFQTHAIDSAANVSSADAKGYARRLGIIDQFAPDLIDSNADAAYKLARRTDLTDDELLDAIKNLSGKQNGAEIIKDFKSHSEQWQREQWKHLTHLQKRFFHQAGYDEPDAEKRGGGPGGFTLPGGMRITGGSNPLSAAWSHIKEAPGELLHGMIVAADQAPRLTRTRAILDGRDEYVRERGQRARVKVLVEHGYGVRQRFVGDGSGGKVEQRWLVQTDDPRALPDAPVYTGGTRGPHFENEDALAPSIKREMDDAQERAERMAEDRMDDLLGADVSWADAWGKANDGDFVWKPAKLSAAKGAVGDDDFAFGLLKQVASSTNPNRVLEEVVAKGGDYGSPGFARASARVARITSSEGWNRAVEILKDGKTGPGRAMADDLHLAPNESRTSAYGLVSGATDAMVAWYADPTNIVLGGLLPAVRAARFAVAGREGIEAIEATYKADKAARAAAKAEGIGAQARLAVANLPRRLNPAAWVDPASLAHARQQGRAVDRMAEVYVHGDDAAVGKLRRELPWFSANSNQVSAWDAHLSAINQGPGIQGPDDVWKLLKSDEGMAAMAAGHGSPIWSKRNLYLPRYSATNKAAVIKHGWLRVNDFAVSTGDELAKAGGALAIPKKIVGKSLATGGTLGRALALQIPRQRVIDLETQAGVDDFARLAYTQMTLTHGSREAADRAVGAFIRGSLDEAQPAWHFADGTSIAAHSANDATRRMVVKDYLMNVFADVQSKAGVADPKLKDAVDDYVEHLTGEHMRYAANRRDVMSRSGRHVAVFPQAQRSGIISIPNTSSLAGLLRRSSFSRRFLGFTQHNVWEAAMRDYWKPAMVLRVGFIPRAAGEEALAFIARVGSLNYARDIMADYAAKGAYAEGLRQAQNNAAKYADSILVNSPDFAEGGLDAARLSRQHGALSQQWIAKNFPHYAEDIEAGLDQSSFVWGRYLNNRMKAANESIIERMGKENRTWTQRRFGNVADFSNAVTVNATQLSRQAMGVVAGQRRLEAAYQLMRHPLPARAYAHGIAGTETVGYDALNALTENPPMNSIQMRKASGDTVAVPKIRVPHGEEWQEVQYVEDPVFFDGYATDLGYIVNEGSAQQALKHGMGYVSPNRDEYVMTQLMAGGSTPPSRPPAPGAPLPTGGAPGGPPPYGPPGPGEVGFGAVPDVVAPTGPPVPDIAVAGSGDVAAHARETVRRSGAISDTYERDRWMVGVREQFRAEHPDLYDEWIGQVARQRRLKAREGRAGAAAGEGERAFGVTGGAPDPDDADFEDWLASQEPGYDADFTDYADYGPGDVPVSNAPTQRGPTPDERLDAEGQQWADEQGAGPPEAPGGEYGYESQTFSELPGWDPNRVDYEQQAIDLLDEASLRLNDEYKARWDGLADNQKLAVAHAIEQRRQDYKGFREYGLKRWLEFKIDDLNSGQLILPAAGELPEVTPEMLRAREQYRTRMDTGEPIAPPDDEAAPLTDEDMGGPPPDQQGEWLPEENRYEPPPDEALTGAPEGVGDTMGADELEGWMDERSYPPDRADDGLSHPDLEALDRPRHVTPIEPEEIEDAADQELVEAMHWTPEEVTEARAIVAQWRAGRLDEDAMEEGLDALGHETSKRQGAISAAPPPGVDPEELDRLRAEMKLGEVSDDNLMGRIFLLEQYDPETLSIRARTELAAMNKEWNIRTGLHQAEVSPDELRGMVGPVLGPEGSGRRFTEGESPTGVPEGPVHGPPEPGPEYGPPEPGPMHGPPEPAPTYGPPTPLTAEDVSPEDLQQAALDATLAKADEAVTAYWRTEAGTPERAAAERAKRDTKERIKALRAGKAPNGAEQRAALERIAAERGTPAELPGPGLHGPPIAPSVESISDDEVRQILVEDAHRLSADAINRAKAPGELPQEVADAEKMISKDRMRQLAKGAEPSEAERARAVAILAERRGVSEAELIDAGPTGLGMVPRHPSEYRPGDWFDLSPTDREAVRAWWRRAGDDARDAAVERRARMTHAGWDNLADYERDAVRASLRQADDEMVDTNEVIPELWADKYLGDPGAEMSDSLAIERYAAPGHFAQAQPPTVQEMDHEAAWAEVMDRYRIAGGGGEGGGGGPMGPGWARWDRDVPPDGLDLLQQMRDDFDGFPADWRESLEHYKDQGGSLWTANGRPASQGAYAERMMAKRFYEDLMPDELARLLQFKTADEAERLAIHRRLYRENADYASFTDRLDAVPDHGIPDLVMASDVPLHGRKSFSQLQAEMTQRIVNAFGQPEMARHLGGWERLTETADGQLVALMPGNDKLPTYSIMWDNATADALGARFDAARGAGSPLARARQVATGLGLADNPDAIRYFLHFDADRFRAVRAAMAEPSSVIVTSAWATSSYDKANEVRRAIGSKLDADPTKSVIGRFDADTRGAVNYKQPHWGTAYRNPNAKWGLTRPAEWKPGAGALGIADHEAPQVVLDPDLLPGMYPLGLDGEQVTRMNEAGMISGNGMFAANGASHMEALNSAGATMSKTMGDWLFNGRGDPLYQVGIPMARHGEVSLAKIHSIPTAELPSYVVAKPQVYDGAAAEGLYRKAIRFGFDKVVGPALSSLVRRPMFIEAYADGLDQAALLQRDLRRNSVHERNLSGIARDLNDFRGVRNARKLDRIQGEIDDIEERLTEALADHADALASNNAYRIDRTTWKRGQVEAERAAKRAELHAVAGEDSGVVTTDDLKQWWSKVDEDTKRQWPGMRVQDQRAALENLGAPVSPMFTKRRMRELGEWGRYDEHVGDMSRQVATEWALNKTIPFIDDHRVKSVFSHEARNIFPFLHAEEQFLKRWARTLAVAPASLRKGQLLMNGMLNVGMLHKDPDTGQTWFVYPGSTEMMNVLAHSPIGGLIFGDVAQPMVQPLSGNIANVLSGVGQPGQLSVTPLVSMPLDGIGRMFPELDPIGEKISGRSADRAPLEALLPAWLRTGIESMTADETSAAINSATIQTIAILTVKGDEYRARAATAEKMGKHAKAVKLLEKAQTYSPDDSATALQQKRFADNVTRHARGQILMRGIAGFLGPVQPKGSLPPEARKEYISLLSRMPADEAVAELMDRHPNESAYTIFATDSPSGAYIPPTKEAMKFIEDNPDLATRFPLGGAFLLPQARGDFDQGAYHGEVSAGFRRYRTAEEWERELHFQSVGRPYFAEQRLKNKALDAARTAEDRGEVIRLEAEWRSRKGYYTRKFPLFMEMLQDPERRTRREQVLTELREALDDPEVPETEQSQPLRDVIRSYDQYKLSKAHLFGNTAEVVDARKELDRQWAEFLNEGPMQDSRVRSFTESVIARITNVDRDEEDR
jgi:hypothetical protein